MDNEGMLQLDLKAIIKLIFKNLWIIVLVAFLFTGVAAYVNIYRVTPIYESKVSMYVMQKYHTDLLQAPSYDDIMVSQQMVKDYSEILKSTRVTKAVIENLGLEDMTSEELAGKLSITLKKDTNLLEIIVTDTNPLRAKDIANTVSEVLIDKIREITSQDNISIVDMAQQPSRPIATKGKVNVAVAFILSLMISLGFIFFLDYLDNTVKTVEDVENKLGYSVIGIIPKMDIK